MASFALFNFEFEPVQNKLRQAELKGMESVLMSASEAFPRKQEIFGDILLRGRSQRIYSSPSNATYG